VGCLLSIGLLAGCAADAEVGFSTRTLPAGDDDVAIAAAEQAFREHFRIERSVRGQRVLLELKSDQAESVQRGGTGRLRDGVAAVPERVRRLGTLRLTQQRGQLRAQCQVRRQRLDTSELEMFHRTRTDQDIPSDTPIDRQAVSPEHNAVWTDVGRDLDLEREILASLAERLGDAATPPPPAE
jgi:hypothetical protein